MSAVSDVTLSYLPAKRKTTPSGVFSYFMYKYTTRSIKGMFYLYVKTHKKTGLKYLGQTSRDPYVYKGSGLRWTNHIKKHGYDVDTLILLETTDKVALSEAGLYYSNLYNVVNDYNWANIVAESGTGGDTSKSPNFIESMKHRDFSYRQDLKYKEKVSIAVKKYWNTRFEDPSFNKEEYKKMCSERSKSMWESRGITDEDRILRSKRQTEYLNTPGVKESLSQKAKAAWLKKSKTYEVTFPNGHTEVVKSFRGWCKDNNYPYYKLYNTIRNNKPSKDGWQVRIIED